MWIQKGYLKKVVVMTYLSLVIIYRFVAMFYAIYLFLSFSLLSLLMLYDKQQRRPAEYL